MKADYVHKDSRTLEEKPQVFTRWIDTTIEELKHQNQKYKEVIDKAIEYINDNLTISSILDGEKYYTINNYSFDYKELLDILNEVAE